MFITNRAQFYEYFLGKIYPHKRNQAKPQLQDCVIHFHVHVREGKTSLDVFGSVLYPS